MSGRAWTAEDLEFLRENYSTRTARWIARKVGRSAPAVLQQAAVLGLRKIRTRRGAWREQMDEFLRAAIAAGKLDGEMADDWNALGRWSVNARAICYYRHLLGIEMGDVQKERRLAQRRNGLRKQLEVLGCRTFGEVHKRRLRREAASAGWPLDCSRFEVRVLNLMADGKPRTKREIAEALGFQLRTSRDTLMTRKGGGSVLANLVSRGLLVRSKGRPVAGRGKGSAYRVWWLSAKASIYHARCTRRRWVG